MPLNTKVKHEQVRKYHGYHAAFEVSTAIKVQVAWQGTYPFITQNHNPQGHVESWKPIPTTSLCSARLLIPSATPCSGDRRMTVTNLLYIL